MVGSLSGSPIKAAFLLTQPAHPAATPLGGAHCAHSPPTFQNPQHLPPLSPPALPRPPLEDRTCDLDVLLLHPGDVSLHLKTVFLLNLWAGSGTGRGTVRRARSSGERALSGAAGQWQGATSLGCYLSGGCSMAWSWNGQQWAQGPRPSWQKGPEGSGGRRRLGRGGAPVLVRPVPDTLC